MKHIIEFDLDNDATYKCNKHDLNQMLKAKDLFLAVREFEEYLRILRKFDNTGEPSAYAVRETFYEIMNKYNINLEELE